MKYIEIAREVYKIAANEATVDASMWEDIIYLIKNFKGEQDRNGKIILKFNFCEWTIDLKIDYLLEENDDTKEISINESIIEFKVKNDVYNKVTEKLKEDFDKIDNFVSEITSINKDLGTQIQKNTFIQFR